MLVFLDSNSAELEKDSSLKNKSPKVETNYCVWLIPDKANYEILQQTIKTISQIKKVPAFKPHMVIFCGKTINIVGVKKKFVSIFKRQDAIKIKIGFPKRGDHFSNKFYLKVQNSNTLEALHLKASKLDKSSHYEFLPHITLYYGKYIPSDIIDIPKKYLYKLSQPKLVKAILVMDNCLSKDYSCINEQKQLSEASFT